MMVQTESNMVSSGQPNYLSTKAIIESQKNSSVDQENTPKFDEFKKIEGRA